MLLVLWAAFLKLQLSKAQHNNCTLPFAIAAAGQAVMLGLVTVAFVYYQARFDCVCLMMATCSHIGTQCTHELGLCLRGESCIVT